MPKKKLTRKLRVREEDGLYEIEFKEQKRTKIADDPVVYNIIFNQISSTFEDTNSSYWKMVTENIIAELKDAGKMV